MEFAIILKILLTQFSNVIKNYKVHKLICGQSSGEYSLVRHETNPI